MNGAHIHLFTNHIPIVGTGLSVLLVALALWRPAGGWLAAGCLTLAVSAAGAAAAYLSGDAAATVVEQIPRMSGRALELHHQRAGWALAACVAAAVIGILVLVTAARRGAEASRRHMGAVLLVSTLAAGTMAWTSLAGGRINHPELQEPEDRLPGGHHGAAGARHDPAEPTSQNTPHGGMGAAPQSPPPSHRDDHAERGATTRPRARPDAGVEQLIPKHLRPKATIFHH